MNRTERNHSLDKTDFLCLSGLVIVLAVYFVFLIDFSAHPSEDAAMLMRYAKHLSEGHGFVWNPGEQPLDGATDFLPVVLIATVMKFGLTLEASTRLLAIVSHVLTLLLVYAGARRFHGAHRWMALFSAAFLAFGPAVAYIQAYFTTTCFTLSICLSWFLANQLMAEQSSRVTSFLRSLLPGDGNDTA